MQREQTATHPWPGQRTQRDDSKALQKHLNGDTASSVLDHVLLAWGGHFSDVPASAKTDEDYKPITKMI
jgi:hypothetical protein